MNTGVAILKRVIPPGAWQLLKRLKPRTWGFFGDYPTYEAALAACGGEGYHSEEIVAKTLEGLRQLRATCEAAPERCDARTQSVLAALVLPLTGRKIADRLRVLDFGGALGNLYVQVSRFLPPGLEVRWDVVETPVTAQAGKRHLADAHLTFSADLAEHEADAYDVVISSSCLQYTDQPVETFARLCRLSTDFILLNRVPLIPGEKDRLTIQKTHPSVYSATYPAWFFSEAHWLRLFEEHGFVVRMRWQVPEDQLELDGVWRANEGFLLQRVR
ncbi:hypothetical protein D3C86_1412720 [compost metagenome]